MAQQINLCTPILPPKRYFSAQTMAITLGVLSLLGGLCAGLGFGTCNRPQPRFNSPWPRRSANWKA